jgi:hypothetical protein
MKRILVAAVPAAASIIADVVSGIASLTIVHAFDEAAENMVRGFDLIIAGTHFDGARMFDLLRFAKANPSSRDIPFLCVRGVVAPDGVAGVPIVARMDVADRASEVLGAAGFVDLCQVAHGRAPPAAELKRLTRACLGMA